MVLPIYVYGEPILREETASVPGDSAEVQQLVDDMIETMYNAAGIGLAAPQVGRALRIFVVDVTPMLDEFEEDAETLPEQPMVFINPELVWESDDATEYEEGCLSIPDIRESVLRPKQIRMRYLDRDFREHEIDLDSLLARAVQHEYDHLDGILFIDHLSGFKRRVLRRRLQNMARGDVEADYPLQTATTQV